MTRNGASIIERVQAEGIRYIDLQFVDILGTVKSVTIPAHRFQHVAEHREWFDGSSVEGFARISESDLYLRPDPSTFAVIPWERNGERTARLIADAYTPRGEPFAGDPRYILRRVTDQASEAGFAYNVGPEMEFFLFRSAADDIVPVPDDTAGYFDLSTDSAYQVRKEMSTDLEAMGIEVETSHHEVATGQHEIDFHYLPALEAADAAVTLKWVVRAVAQRHGLHASFMPKPLFGVPGSGMHVHQSLFSVEDGTNLFADAEDTYGLSAIARHFIAGQMAHARGMSAVLAPLVNSYKRLVAGYEAPVYISWARMNRSALIRVPETTPGDLSATRIELRLPDPSCNPYLGFAVMLAAGLDGIERELQLPAPVEENLFAFDPARRVEFSTGILPATLQEALDELERDDLVCETLGPHLLERFVEAKRMEWEEYRTQVTPWELKRYLRIH